MEDIKEKKNLLDFTCSELERALKEEGQKAFRAKQLANWFYKKLVFNPDHMSNLSRDLKELIEEKFKIYIPQISHIDSSNTDGSHKFLLETSDGKQIESILMIEDGGRHTVCVSCMIGCPMGCKFCATGSQIGFVRKLTVAEIVGQVLITMRYARENGIFDNLFDHSNMGFLPKSELDKRELNNSNLCNSELCNNNLSKSEVDNQELDSRELDNVENNNAGRVTNIVFMGMGEPFANLPNVKKAIDILTHSDGLAMSPAKISVSTAFPNNTVAGFINETNVRLAVSLHFPTNELRSKYMPVNKFVNIEQVVSELKRIKLKKRDYILIEYILLSGINDSLQHAKQLLSVIGNLKVKVNLIPYNPTELFPEKASSKEVINAFAKFLSDKGIFTSVRKSRGIDIDGGCGQFALKRS